mgnify:CR=1 FL=1
MQGMGIDPVRKSAWHMMRVGMELSCRSGCK